jgi:TPP-dependent pyruvate/acetoin dehydrogenase alpha subunit
MVDESWHFAPAKQRAGQDPKAHRSDGLGETGHPAVYVHPSFCKVLSMRRHPVFDPPEYVVWQADPALFRRWEGTLQANPSRWGRARGLPEDQLLELYGDLLRARLIDQMLARWVRQGRLAKAWLATGEEALTVGAVAALDRSRDWVSPILRNQAACFMMGISLDQIFAGWLGSLDSPNQGQDLHIGSPVHHVLAPISSMGSNLPVVTGLAMGLQRAGEGGVALTWIGDGATSTGEFHEGLTLARAMRAPAIFIIQDNQIALGTPSHPERSAQLARLGEAYGIPTQRVDGNHILDVWAAVAEAVEACRSGLGPVLIHGLTFRMGGHSTHDGPHARALLDPAGFREWGARDPVGGFELWLETRGIQEEQRTSLEERVIAEVEDAAGRALSNRPVRGNPRRHDDPGTRGRIA